MTGSIAVKVLRKLARSVYDRRRWYVYPQLVLFGLCVWYTIENLEFNTSRNDLVGSDKKYHQIFLQFKKDFNLRDDIVAVVESEDPEKNRQFVERLAAKVEKETNLFSDVFYRGDLKMLGPKALLFVDERTLGEMLRTLKVYRPFIARFGSATNLNSLFQMVNNQFWAAAMQHQSQTNSQTESLIEALPALRRILEQGTASLRRLGTPPSPGITMLFGASEKAQQEQYITFDKGRLYLLNARPLAEETDMRGVVRLRELVRETLVEVPGVNAGITGEAVLEYDEMQQSQTDSTVATIVSLVLCALLFIVSYRETGRPLKATAALIVGLGYTVGFTTLTVGHLNILTITFLPILIGLAIDFGVHLITRYEEELRRGTEQYLAIERAMVNTGLGIFTGCLTTAGAFFAMALTDFKGIQEMGIITGGGMILSLVPMMTMLPAMILRGKQNKIDQAKHQEESVRARVERFLLARPATVIGVVAVISLLAIIPARRVRFDYNLLHMQSEGLPAVVLEHKLIKGSTKSVLYAAVIAPSKEEAVRLETQITNLPTVAAVDSMAKYLVGDQSGKLQLIGKIKQEANAIHFAPLASGPVNVNELSRTLWSLNGYLGLAVEALEKENKPELQNQLRLLRQAIDDFRHEMLTGDRPQASRKLAAYERALFSDLQETFHAIRTQDNSASLTEEDLPKNLRARFIGKDGQHLLQVYPKSNAWERAEQEAFVREVRSVAPNATGTPVQLYEYTTLLKDSYIEAAYYSLGAITLLVLIHFRKITSVIFSLLPVAIGSLWTLGLMGLFTIPFNPANIMTLPLVVGIGVTNGIHILNRFAEERNPSILARSTGKAVIVSGLTTIAGFGSLILAKHQGIQTLGIVMSLGVAMCMIAAVTFLPALLMLMQVPAPDNKKTQ